MKHLEIILIKMFSYVGAKYSKEFVKSERWFLKHEWTAPQENDFKKWLTDYLYNNKLARIELMTYSYKNKKNCIKAANEFIFNYGWKTNNYNLIYGC